MCGSRRTAPTRLTSTPSKSSAPAVESSTCPKSTTACCTSVSPKPPRYAHSTCFPFIHIARWHPVEEEVRWFVQRQCNIGDFGCATRQFGDWSYRLRFSHPLREHLVATVEGTALPSAKGRPSGHDDQPIAVRAWNSASSRPINATQTPVLLYAEVLQVNRVPIESSI